MKQLLDGVSEQKIGDTIDFSKDKCGLFHKEKYVSIPPLDASEITYYETGVIACGGDCSECCHGVPDEPGCPCYKPRDSDAAEYEDREKEKLWGSTSSKCLCAYTIGGAGTIYTIAPSKE